MFLLCLLVLLVAACLMPSVASAAVTYVSFSSASTTTTTLTLTKPAGTAAGDLLLVQITRKGGGSVTPPADWTVLYDTDQGTDVGQAILYKFAGAGEGADYSFTIDYAGAASGTVGAAILYTGVDSTSAIAASSSNVGSGTSVTALSVDAPDDSVIVGAFGVLEAQSANYPRTPTGMTPITRVRISPSAGPCLRIADEAITAAGATGDRVSPASPTSPWVAHLVVLNPAPVPLTVTATADDRAYDGTTDATAHLASADILPGDDVTLTCTSAAFDSKDVAAGKTVSVDGIAIGGADAGKYTLQNTAATTTAAITAAELTVGGAVAQDRAYDGTTDAGVDFGTAALVGVVGSEDVTLDASAYTAAFAAKDVGGGIAVAVDGLALIGADASNYALTQPAGLTADISAAELTVSGALAQDKAYDGTTTASVDFSAAALVGVVGSDDVTLDASAYTAAFDSGDVGSDVAVAVNGLTLGGADAGNYTLSPPAGLRAAITAADLTVSGALAQDKAYDGTTDALVDFSAATLAGVFGSDEVTLDASAYTAAFAAKDVGGGVAVTVDGLALIGADAGNYVLTQPAGLTAAITAAPLTVTATADDKAYDGTVDATAHVASADILAGDDVTLTCTSAAFDSKDVGAAKTVSVDGIAIGGADAGDYELQNTSATATAAITPAELTVSGALAQDRAYDGTTDAGVDFGTAALVGVVGSEDVTLDASAYTAAFAGDDVGSDIAVDVDALVLAGADAGNYVLTPPAGLTAAITAAPLTVTATADDRLYDGTIDATAHLASADILLGDDVTLTCTSAAFASKDVGAGKTVTVDGIAIGGADAGNYELQNTTAATTAAISARGLTIAAKNQTKVYGKTFVFTGTEFTASGLVTGEAVSGVTLASAGAAAKAIGGAYPIVASAATGTGLGNYDIGYVNGTMTVVGGYRIPSFYKPLRIADPRRFHRGATIRVAFRVRDPNGKLIVNAHPTLRVTRSGRVVVGPKAVKYYPTKRLYVYNLRTTQAWRLSTYTLRVSLGVGSTGRSVSFRVIR